MIMMASQTTQNVMIHNFKHGLDKVSIAVDFKITLDKCQYLASINVS